MYPIMQYSSKRYQIWRLHRAVAVAEYRYVGGLILVVYLLYTCINLRVSSWNNVNLSVRCIGALCWSSAACTSVSVLFGRRSPCSRHHVQLFTIRRCLKTNKYDCCIHVTLWMTNCATTLFYGQYFIRKQYRRKVRCGKLIGITYKTE